MRILRATIIAIPIAIAIVIVITTAQYLYLIARMKALQELDLSGKKENDSGIKSL